MTPKPDAEPVSTDVTPAATVEQSLVVRDMGSATEKTKGAPGFHREIGVPPFATHP